jgi:hypothetical protein
MMMMVIVIMMMHRIKMTMGTRMIIISRCVWLGSPRKMNAWLQQVRAEGLRIVYVTMGNWAQGKRVTVLGKLSDANCVSAPSWSPNFFFITKTLGSMQHVAGYCWGLDPRKFANVPPMSFDWFVLELR